MGKGKAFSTTEVALIQKHASEGKSVRTIATYTKRSPSAVAGVVRGKPKRGAGAPSKLNKRSEVAFLNSLERLQKKADGQYEVRFSFVNPSCTAPLAGGRAFFFSFSPKKGDRGHGPQQMEGQEDIEAHSFPNFQAARD